MVLDVSVMRLQNLQRSLVRSFSARYDTVSHVGGIVFHSIQQSTLVYHTRRDTLLYLTKSSIILDIHFLVLYIRRDAPPYFTMSAHPGFIPSSGILLCVGPHLLLLSGSSGFAVFKHTHSSIV
jgi:hypothetical protein